MENQSNENKPEKVAFSVDAGIISRLGKELVGRAETAVSELIKNSFDADANLVTLNFIDTDNENGCIEIVDDGNGMNREELINGFMRLSTSEKIHNPTSPKYGRLRAGRKGIGRFATQRLGTKLTIVTKKEHEYNGFELKIDWDKYKVDQDLESIYNTISQVSIGGNHGTTLIIEGLRESWSEAQIKRVFRYISDLLQPNYSTSRKLQKAKKRNDDTFEVNCYKIVNGEEKVIADIDTMIFENSLGKITGEIKNGKAFCIVQSNRFNINDKVEFEEDFTLLESATFEVYYFIYKYKWYSSFIPKMEYNKIVDLAQDNSGVKLYRNGFRVLPYGEKGNDWLNIDKTSVKTQSKGYVPFNNINFSGFVEVFDPMGEKFEETSSREGLIENDSFNRLIDYVNRSLRLGAQRINSQRISEKNKISKSQEEEGEKHKSITTKDKLHALKDKSKKEDRNIIEEAIESIEEVQMLRVLAGIGLNIAEFVHEIRQFIPSFNGSINYLLSQDINEESRESLINMKSNFNRFKTYTSYIDHTLSQNANREKRPIDLRKIIRDFHEVVLADLDSRNVTFTEDYYGYDIISVPMHPSEWTSILYNLYSNSIKAIKRANPDRGLIKIICGKLEDYIYLEFLDNGDGIPEENKNRIFKPFFSTTIPAMLDSNNNDLVTGTGLGLKIVKDIVVSYEGRIYLKDTDDKYSTNFCIEIPKASQKQLIDYGY